MESRELPEALAQRFQQLSHSRRRHSYGVEAIAGYLARLHGVSVATSRLAGLAHDLARELSPQALVQEAQRLELAADTEEWASPILLHGPIAAAWLQATGCGTPAVWEAVRYHTTGVPDPTALTQVLFIADAVEPGRRYPDRDALLSQAVLDLGQGYRAVLESSLGYFAQVGVTPHPRTLDALYQSGAQ